MTAAERLVLDSKAKCEHCRGKHRRHVALVPVTDGKGAWWHNVAGTHKRYCEAADIHQAYLEKFNVKLIRNSHGQLYMADGCTGWEES